MPDEQKPSEQTGQSPVVVQLPQNVPTLYVNAWTTQLGQGDVTIQFGLNPTNDPEAGIEPVVSLILTHASFLRLAMSLGTAGSVITKLYNGQIPALADLSRERLEAAMEEVRNEQAAFQSKAQSTFQQADEEQKGG